MIIRYGWPQKILKIKTNIAIPLIIKRDRTWAKSDAEMAETFAVHLTALEPNTNNVDAYIEDFLNIPSQMSACPSYW